MKKFFVFPLLLGLLVFLAACGNTDSPIEENMPEVNTVPDFTYTTQDGESFGLDDLEGKWWIANFIFTNCTSVCPPMTTNMALLQDKINEAELEDVHIVSFTVDPDFDKPEVLRNYAEMFGIDLDNWTFLTGYDFQTIKELSIKTFMALLREPERGSDQVTHSSRFFLVNPEGKVIKLYDGESSKEMDNIFEDLEKVS